MTIETDPTGKQPSEPGAKLDAGKIRMGLMYEGFSNALREVSKVSTYGAKKYSPGGWLKVPDGISRYNDAMHRHLNAAARGEDIDIDTGICHEAHAAWNALAILELKLLEKIQ